MVAIPLLVPALSPGAARAGAGDLDPSFGGAGRAILPFRATPGDVLVQPDGKILVTDSQRFTVLRLNPDGSPDDGFDGDGAAGVNFGPDATIQSAALQPDGKIVVSGLTGSLATAVARLKPDGSLDPTFAPGEDDGDGKKVGGLAPWHADATVVQPDGRIVIAGISPSGITATRLDSNGSPDGTVFEYARASVLDSVWVRAAALAPDGALVVAGHALTHGATAYELAVARFRPDGKLDKSLAGTGMVKLGTEGAVNLPVAVFVRPDGRIVVAGDGGSAEQRMTVTQLNPDGTPDDSFGAGGSAAPDFAGDDYAAGAALQPDGRILLAGTTEPGYTFAVARLEPTGALDAGFGAGGKTTIPFDDVALAGAAGLQPDGNFVIAGVTVVDDGTAVRTALARVLGETPPATSTTTTSTSTTTTLPGGCFGGAASEAIICRLARLREDVRARVPAGRFQRRLLGLVGKAGTKVEAAQAKGSGRKAKRALGTAARALRRVIVQLGSRRAQAIAEPWRTDLTQGTTSLEDDVLTLRGVSR